MGLAGAECYIAKSRDPLDFPSPFYSGCIESMRPSKMSVLTDSKQKLPCSFGSWRGVTTLMSGN